MNRGETAAQLFELLVYIAGRELPFAHGSDDGCLQLAAVGRLDAGDDIPAVPTRWPRCHSTVILRLSSKAIP